MDKVYFSEESTLSQWLYLTYQVTITWSERENHVVICTLTRKSSEQLHLATQQFLSFYHQLASNVVAAPLNCHVTNITLHQYHKASDELKKDHAKAMVKEVETTGRLALYCPVNNITEAKRTFLKALVGDLTESLTPAYYRKTCEGLNLPPKPPAHQRPEKRRKNERKTIRDACHSKSFVNPSSTSVYIKSASSFSQPNCLESDDTEASDRDVRRSTSFDRSNSTWKPRFVDETSSSNNSSSGYDSNNGASYRQYGYYDATMKHHPHPGFQYETRRTSFPPTSHQNKIDHTHLHDKYSQSHALPTIRRDSPTDYSMYYYNDIQQSGELSPPNNIGRPNTQDLLDVQTTSCHQTERSHGESEKLPKQQQKTSFKTTKSLSYSKMSGHVSPLPASTKQQSVLLNKPSVIPKMEGPFQIIQNHKKYFELTTRNGLLIEVHEGDVTEADSDVVVNVTNTNLHVTGELAWTVAKRGCFEIPKLAKLHVAMHGPVMESKVVVTTSAGLPSNNILHAVLPKWVPTEKKKSRKLLFSTYKNIFNVANIELKAKSIALPIIGLESPEKSEEAFPFHMVADVMYQSLIAFIKLGSTTLRHIRYIDSHPNNVNLIVTSIKPKLESVTFDERFLKLPQLHNSKVAISSVTTMYSDDGRNCYDSPPPLLMTSPSESSRNAQERNRSLTRTKTVGRTRKKR